MKLYHGRFVVLSSFTVIPTILIWLYRTVAVSLRYKITVQSNTMRDVITVSAKRQIWLSTRVKVFRFWRKPKTHVVHNETYFISVWIEYVLSQFGKVGQTVDFRPFLRLVLILPRFEGKFVKGVAAFQGTALARISGRPHNAAEILFATARVWIAARCVKALRWVLAAGAYLTWDSPTSRFILFRLLRSSSSYYYYYSLLFSLFFFSV